MTWTQQRWGERRARVGLPSHCTVDRWCRAGVLGPDHETMLGHGNYRRFTGHELDKLEAVERVVCQFRVLGFAGVPYALVAQLWEGLDCERGIAVVHGGPNVVVMASLHEVPG